MFGSDLYIALILGVLLSLIFAEKTGIVPAGLVLSKIMILYGRRKFAAMLITGILLKIGFDFIYPVMPFEIAEFRGIGIIVPGLIANTIQRQGLTITLGSTLLLSGATFVIMYAYYLI
ncbi:poly-gamma-glutamate biosynthesis protein PgsC/CapC [Bacillus paralicheniformis]|uniref:poly-gamma-glutamate biosynthesis protein PgsC/CapC n=1 Tax=Bacillus paralicheniformis TaxID=1648923 RepID=UPI001897701D|nr:poly-gamma-glutamate biosynthesis protein PgsC/CapC [Bacillus paralicheniformis]